MCGCMRTPAIARSGARPCRPIPKWQAFIKMSAEAGYLIKQENKILTPAPFFTLER